MSLPTNFSYALFSDTIPLYSTSDMSRALNCDLSVGFSFWFVLNSIVYNSIKTFDFITFPLLCNLHKI